MYLSPIRTKQNRNLFLSIAMKLFPLSPLVELSNRQQRQQKPTHAVKHELADELIAKHKL